ncbi:GNAT family N-acetyltransferase [Planctomyces sp. SH-PL14]|uniref:GNAT family N-acetyltransferase n=1 Tax=Planctomyces sp. SH-PL14 TaxID=1632864 RepID=UPI00078E0BF7|nr:GNAT family N-acetyltransferase [Planctomyces sp. SH-PL14]AMV21858.1 putative acetyltransferase [Planctomyces sp. SH-PL14]
MPEIRPFRNGDVPDLVRLWNESDLGRGAAHLNSVEVLESATFNRSYFDHRGCLMALDEGKLVGFGLAGPAISPDRSSLDLQRGVICFVVVHPSARRRGIGRALVHRLEQYLRTRGVQTIYAGPHRGADPFGFGLYGGCRPSGFLRSDPAAEPFFLSLGYCPDARYEIKIRDLTTARDPTSARLMTIRRQVMLAIDERPDQPTWWWYEQYGRAEAFRFHLRMRRGGEMIASINAVRLDQYADKWQANAVGLVDLDVSPDYRGKGFGQTLLVEACRELRQQNVGLVELSLPMDNPIGLRAATNAGFVFADSGMAYRLNSSSPHDPGAALWAPERFGHR